jgi:tetratricopeptide (TPR) repeat protein
MLKAQRALRSVAAVCVLAAAGCAHGPLGHGLSRSSQHFASEAAGVKRIAYEEDFLDARLVLQALPVGSRERAALRVKLVQYLLGPIAQMDLESARKDANYFGSNDDYERLFESFHDALDLFAASELWSEGGLRLAPEERQLLAVTARSVVQLFSPRGNEQAVATALFVLESLEPKERAWTDRLQQLFAWLDTGTEIAGGARAAATTPAEVLENVSSVWPSPAVVQRLTAMAVDRQDRIAHALRRPLGTGTGRSAIGDLLLDNEALQSLAVNVAALYLRCGELRRAEEAIAPLTGKVGDDRELRLLISNAARSGASGGDFLALARRFLPRSVELLGGTSNDRLDPPASAEILRRGLERHPNDTNLLVLASRVARFQPAPFLALRYLEEAQLVLERGHASPDVLAEISAEQLELSFSRLRVHIDPDRIEPAAREAETLRQQFAENRRRFGDARFKLRDADIDFELARGFVDAGLIDRAEPLLLRAHHDAEASVEVNLQIGRLVSKQGDSSRAAQILRQALESLERNAPPEETIGFVEAQSKLARALGDTYEVGSRLDEARRAWKLAARGWERLRVEQVHRKNAGAASEATFELGRLLYLLGAHGDAIQKFNEAIELNEGRDQTYIDTLAFLVQHGESEAALDIYRRVLAKPTRTVSEYVKVYASLWILDITRRASKAPDPAAEAFLRSLDTRKLHLRPARAAAWYIPLARFAIGRLSYDQILPLADTAGKRAELYFYEAMRRLADGRSDDAHSLWNKVLETKMFSFFEFDMASRYLRSGAPTAPRAETPASDSETI